MNKFVISANVPKRESAAIERLQHSKTYKAIIFVVRKIFSPVKYFVFSPFHISRRIFGVISFTVYKIFGFTFAYVDDFIIHKNLRGKGFSQELFHETEKQIKKKRCSYLFLVSGRARAGSHKFYKKAGLTIIALGIGIIAYKKILHNKN